MLIRAGLIFLIVVTLTVFTLQHLVQSHVQGVAVVHAQDKAQHRTDMIERVDGLSDVFTQNGEIYRIEDQIHRMAHDTDIIDMVFYDVSGEQIAVVDAPSGAMAGMDHSTHRTDPSGARAHLAEHSGHDAAPVEMPAAPDQLDVGLLDASQPHFDIMGSIATEWHSPIVTAVIPIHDPDDEKLGYVRYQVAVSDVVTAYASGLTRFAAVLVLLGIAIFGVPAVGYGVQKRIADRSNSDAKYLASFDALTGLLNRRGFIVRAEAKVLEGALKNIAFLDADAFKTVNDTYGHSVGDAYLQSISKAITTIFGDDAITSRFGGDEFVIADGESSRDEFAALLDRLRAICAKEIDLSGVTVRSTVSVGIARAEAGQSLDDLLSDADMALYFAKADGGNRVTVFDREMSTEMERLRALESRLRDAVAHNDFTLHYQPLIHSQTREVFGYEALLRLSDQDGNTISPTEFIPLAEKMGLIEEIGTWVIQVATRQIAGMNSRDVIAINLSTEQFKSGKLVGIVKDALSQANLPPERLELEITESLLLDDSDKVAFQINALKDMGVSVAMDDFGTGFSSLSYLWKFGFDRLKIDQSFIHALEEDPERSLSLIEAIVTLAKNLEMEITAEGVETQSQSAVLSSLGCDVLQGFYFGRPEPLSSPALEQAESGQLPKTG